MVQARIVAMDTEWRFIKALLHLWIPDHALRAVRNDVLKWSGVTANFRNRHSGASRNPWPVLFHRCIGWRLRGRQLGRYCFDFREHTHHIATGQLAQVFVAP